MTNHPSSHRFNGHNRLPPMPEMDVPIIGQTPRQQQAHEIILQHAAMIAAAPFAFQEIVDQLRPQIEKQPTDAAKADVARMVKVCEVMAYAQMILRGEAAKHAVCLAADADFARAAMGAQLAALTGTTPADAATDKAIADSITPTPLRLVEGGEA